MFLGKGHMGEVFAISDQSVVKLFYDHISQDVVEYEAAMTDCAIKSNVAVPRAENIIQHDGRFGIIFERIHGSPLLDCCLKKPWLLVAFAKNFSNEHKTFHKLSIDEGRSQYDEIKYRILSNNLLNQDQKQIIIKRLDCLPIGSNLCHGDFHLNNIMQSEKELVVIDWGGAMKGNPIADAAHTSLLLKLGELPRDCSFFTKFFASIFRSLFSQLYVHFYFKKRKATLKEFKEWILPMASARLASNNKDEKVKLLKIIKKELELIKRTNR